MGCDPPRHAQDAWLGKVLGAGPAWRLDGPTLTVRTEDTELVLTDREVADPDLSLAETPWAVDTLVDGAAASSVPSGGGRDAGVRRRRRWTSPPAATAAPPATR